MSIFTTPPRCIPVPPDIKYVGATEEIVGRWMKTKDRDSLIIATKVAGPSHIWIKRATARRHDRAWTGTISYVRSRAA